MQYYVIILCNICLRRGRLDDKANRVVVVVIKIPGLCFDVHMHA